MKALRLAFILAALAVAPLMLLGFAHSPGAQNQAPPTGGTAPITGALKILSPKPGDVVRQNFVTVKYDLTNTGIAGGAPNFRVQLDNQDPITTTFSEYTFTGLRPGPHKVTVQLVDANNNPVDTVRADIHFNVVQPQSGPAPGASIAGTDAAMIRQASVAGGDQDLPPASSALPLLSVIGFGALLGGIASALKTR